jgi:hypothetical protein
MVEIKSDNGIIPNRFSPQYPADPIYFAGRTAETKTFKDTVRMCAKLTPPSPHNFAILGDWGMGKTSLLYEFEHIVLEELDESIRCVSFYFPLSPNICKTWEKFSASLLFSMSTSLQPNKGLKKKFNEEAKKWAVELDLPLVKLKRNGEQDVVSYIELTEALEKIWKDHLAPKGINIAFILIDDFHLFPATEEDIPFLNLRMTLEDLVKRRCNYSLVISSNSTLFSSAVEVGDPINRFFSSHKYDLKNFSLEETKEAVKKRLLPDKEKSKFDDKVIETVYNLTGGHPFITMLTFYELFARANVEIISMDFFASHWPEIKKDIWSSQFMQVYKDVSFKEKKLLVRIAKAELISNPVSVSDFGKDRTFFPSLERRKLIVRTSRGKYKIFNPLFADFLRQLDD